MILCQIQVKFGDPYLSNENTIGFDVMRSIKNGQCFVYVIHGYHTDFIIGKSMHQFAYNVTGEM